MSKVKDLCLISWHFAKKYIFNQQCICGITMMDRLNIGTRDGKETKAIIIVNALLLRPYH